MIRLLLILYGLVSLSSSCTFPEMYRAQWFSLLDGGDLITDIDSNTYRFGDKFNAYCHKHVSNTTAGLGDNYYVGVEKTSNFSLFNPTDKCYICLEVYERNSNILQYRQSSSCQKGTEFENGQEPKSVEEICQRLAATSQFKTMFRRSPTREICKQSFQGEYQFAYEQTERGGGLCDNPHSTISACHKGGNVYIDNLVFRMKFSPCIGVGSSMDREELYQCMGMWIDRVGNVFIAVTKKDTTLDRERFRCIMTRRDQTALDNKKRYGMSDKAECEKLMGVYNSPIRLIITPKIPTSQYTRPSCNLPVNFTGIWFTTGEFDARVIVNQTHMDFRVKLDQYNERQTIYTCQQNKDSRYLMSAVTVGSCQADYVCFDFLPRKQNIIRYRTGKSYRLPVTEIDALGYNSAMQRKFRQACTWLSFTLRGDRATTWKYSTLLLDPPTPVYCPIAGRFEFQQYGSPAELYRTRIRGVTQRPRVRVDCREYDSVFYSCRDTKKLSVDARYCATLDHRAVPIWDREQYELSDYDLTCVGYFLEDARSYLITYDKEDPISPFRCWVYERINWREVRMSRSVRSACGVKQTPYSSKASEGASLSLHLTENERLHDQCPIRYDTGVTMTNRELEIVVLGHANQPNPSHTFICAALLAYLSAVLCRNL